MKAFNICLLLAALAVGLTSCGDDDPDAVWVEDTTGTGTDTPTPDAPGTTERSGYDEQYRPQIHYTPAHNWINDPNGLVYLDGVYHAFYQYNPLGNDWGNMSWGHAVSTDLVHWQEKSVALTRDNLGDIFSGCCVVDKDNTAGFGANALVAIYTSSGDWQQQSIAYSTDGGNTFAKYDGNPVIANSSLGDFRDPKVFWHSPTSRWIMLLAKGWSHAIDIWQSPDLKSWTKASEFSMPGAARCNVGQWECPDLVELPYNGGSKWVMIVSTNPGGAAGGSGTFYFTGHFDGSAFTADSRDYPLWLDCGADNYAGVTFSNTPGRCLLLGWMNNWNYAGSVPCSPWRSALTLPRELTLADHDGLPMLASEVVGEIEALAGDWQQGADGVLAQADAYALRLTIDIASGGSVRLANGNGEYLEMKVSAGSRKLVVKRNANTGATAFAPTFSLPSITAPILSAGDQLTLDVYVDRSSVEIFSADGLLATTVLVFPKSIYDRVEGDAVANVGYRCLSSIWQ